MWTNLITWLLPKKKSNDTYNNLYESSIDVNLDLLNKALNNMYSNISTSITGAGSINPISTGGHSGGGYTTSIIYPTGSGNNTSATGVSITGTGTWTTVSPSWSSGTISLGTTSFDEIDSDITLKRKGKPDVKIGATLDLICEHLNIIIPEKSLLESNPALKMAYEHYSEVLQKTYADIELKNAYDSYKTLEKLLRSEDGE